MGTSNVAMGPAAAGGQSNPANAPIKNSVSGLGVANPGGGLGTSNAAGGAGVGNPTAGPGYSNASGGGILKGGGMANGGNGPLISNNAMGRGQPNNALVTRPQLGGRRPLPSRFASRLNPLLAGNRMNRLAGRILAGALGGAALSDLQENILLGQLDSGNFTPAEVVAIREVVDIERTERLEAIKAGQPDPADDAALDFATADQAAGSSHYGMLITQVLDGGVAARADLRVDDIILSLGGVRVQSFEDLQTVLASIKGPAEVVFFNSETKQIEKLNVTPVNARIGIATMPVEVE